MRKELIVNKGILHIIDNQLGESQMSAQELDLDSDVCYEFISKHVKRLIDNAAAKEACFNPDSKVLGLVKGLISGEVLFKDFSGEICGILSEIMHANKDIPPGDLIISQFSIGSEEYIAILKLNYKEYFTHKVYDNGTEKDNQIVKIREMLGGKVEEACLIPYHPMVLKVLEKPYVVDGQSRNYFSEILLDCSAEISKKEAADIINEITDEIVEKHFSDSPEQATKIKIALLEESIEEEGVINIKSIASKVFSEDEELKTEYIQMAEEAGIKGNIDFGDKYVKQQFGSYKYKSSTGIELKVPTNLCDDPAIVEFIQNDDGSLSVLLKNMRKS